MKTLKIIFGLGLWEGYKIKLNRIGNRPEPDIAGLCKCERKFKQSASGNSF